MNKTKKILSKKTVIILAVILIISIAVNIILLIDYSKISSRTLSAASHLINLHFTSEERKMMLEDMKKNAASYDTMRKTELPNKVPPAVNFDPFYSCSDLPAKQEKFVMSRQTAILPEDMNELAFYPVATLASLIRSGKITSVQLTELYLQRLQKYGPELKCIVTLTENLALEQARKADREIKAGYYRGPLHGIPYGVKDLIATKDIKTTWGAEPYKKNIPDYNATIVDRLQEAGAVLVAKLSMGALAMGDVWFGGKTKNPWNPEQGSSGSSAGSAAATAAGLVGFSIGTETYGSIVSPSTRCRVTGLRPTFGRVSRYGAMALSWSMDKIGPICRSVEDCALVLHVMYGPDGKDHSVVDYPFNWDPYQDKEKIRVGYLKSVFEKDTSNAMKNELILSTLRNQGFDLIPVELPDYPLSAMVMILEAEAAAAFDKLTRTDKDDLLTRQTENAWPNIFRQARFIPAVEYIQANRIRTLLMQDTRDAIKNVDVFVSPSFQGGTLLLTNLTGHPAVVVPTGADEKGNSTSITFVGRMFQEGKTLLVAKIFQDNTEFHLKQPDMKTRVE
ncbi:MAG: amidase [bacterium]